MAVLQSKPDVLSTAVPFPATWHFRIGWTVAFLEGEGCFQMGSNTAYVTAFQVQRLPLEWLQLMFGGSIYHRHGMGSSWKLCGYAGAGLMMTLYRFMSPKRQQEIHKTLEKWRRRRVYQGVRALCIRGHQFDRIGKRRRECLTCKRMHARRRLDDPAYLEKKRQWSRESWRRRRLKTDSGQLDLSSSAI